MCIDQQCLPTISNSRLPNLKRKSGTIFPMHFGLICLHLSKRYAENFWREERTEEKLMYRYIEQTLLTQGVDSLVLEDLAPTTASRRVGASAFVGLLLIPNDKADDVVQLSE